MKAICGHGNKVAKIYPFGYDYLKGYFMMEDRIIPKFKWIVLTLLKNRDRSKKGKSMYKKIIWILVSMLVFAIGILVAIIYFDFNDLSFHVKDSSKPDEEVVKEIVEVDHKDIDKKEEKEQEYVNPFNQKYKQEELTDRHYQDYLHKMSHQKVVADTKWGFYLITDDRIDWLLESLGVTYESLDEGKIYRDILNKWKDGDFSRVDQDHNAIWKLQGGSIGEATGILNTDEEKEYVESTREAKGKTE